MKERMIRALAVAMCTSFMLGTATVPEPQYNDIPLVCGASAIVPHLNEINIEPGPIIHNTVVSYYVTDEEREHLAKLVRAEARDSDLKFKCLVVKVVLNQKATGKYGETIDEVIFYKNNYSVVKSGHYDRAVPDDECYEAVDLVLDGWDESEGATHFRTIDPTRTSWHDRVLVHLFDYDNGSFYKEK